MLTVGLTGGYASGKSFIGAELERLGAKVIRADELGREAIAKDGPVYADVVREFGRGILLPDGAIDRKRLAGIVFPNPELLARLNALIHPYVFQAEQRRIGELLQADESAIVVVEAAIMIEVGSYQRYDKLVVASCGEEIQVTRAMVRDGAAEQEVRSRMARQLPMAEKVLLADYVIDTSGTKEQTLAETRSLWRVLQAENAAKMEAAAAGKGLG